MKLGAFSISLAVKDIQASKNFYEKMGFTEFGGDQSQNWLIMKNDEHVIGLFQDMFPENILTFNPGWDQDCNPFKDYDDVREIKKTLQSKGIEIADESITTPKGPANITVIDPDGNMILIDQHI